MTPTEAKKILLLRRGPADDADPQVAQAYAVAQSDPELREWLQANEAFHDQMKASFRQLAVPAGLVDRILAQMPAETLPWWRRFPAWGAAIAASLVLYFVVTGGGLRLDAGDSFKVFRSRMVRSVLRQYQMDIETNSMAVIRQFLDSREAPSDFVLTEALNRLPARGAGIQSWQGQRVSMVCLNSAGQGTAILFIVDSGAVKRPPPGTPTFEQVSKLTTASWSSQGKAYLLMIDNPAVDRPALERFF